jgi:hypothetical protein
LPKNKAKVPEFIVTSKSNAAEQEAEKKRLEQE